MFTKPFQSPTPSYLLHLLQLSITSKSLKLAQKTHAQICYLGLNQHQVIITNLMNAYFCSNKPNQSRKLFDSIELKDTYLWNTMINGLVKNNLHSESFNLFNSMCFTIDSFPDEFTFSTLAKVSGDIRDLLIGKWVHGKLIKLGFLSDCVLTNSLMTMYCKCDEIQETRKLFEEMPQRTVSSWNIMLSRYVSIKNSKKPCSNYDVWELFKNMLTEGLRPNEFTLSNLLPLCGLELGTFDYGRELHCYIITNEMKRDEDTSIRLDCCLIDLYSRRSEINLARYIFNETKLKNVFIWTTMMNGYLQNNDPDETVFLFREMLRTTEVVPNEVSLLALLPACSLIAGLLGVKQVHAFSFKNGYENHTTLSNLLLDMYSKNGLLNDATQLFENDCFLKNEISWSSMISGYGLHGKGQDSVDLYDKMLKNGTKPDEITIVGVLSACSKSGLVEKGLDIYNKAISVYGIKPTVEMCSCVVDLLGRAGQLDEALTFIKTPPIEPGPSVWGALVSASLVHTNYDMKVLAYKLLIEIEPENGSNYVLLSNLYAAAGRWDCVADVRRIMNGKSLRKLPGWSWITVDGKIYSFLAADKAHSASDQVYEMLNELSLVMKNPDLDR